jgi:DNA-binding HxlR family transcriptional regulator
VLSARLRSLERNGVVTRQVAPTLPPSVEQSLSRLGREVMPAINSTSEVGARLEARR